MNITFLLHKHYYKCRILMRLRYKIVPLYEHDTYGVHGSGSNSLLILNVDT
jgi:hypothetical protein